MDQRRLWLAVGISIAVLIGYQEFVLRHWTPAETAPTERARLDPAPSDRPAVEAAAAPVTGLSNAFASPVGDGGVVAVETDSFLATFARNGGRLASLSLKGFRRTVAEDGQILDLVTPGDVLPLTLDLGGGQSDAAVRYESDQAQVRVTGTNQQELVLRGSAPGGTQIERRYSFSGTGYAFDMAVRVSGPNAPAAAGVVLTPVSPEASTGGQGAEAMALAEGKTVNVPIASLADEAQTVDKATWAGFVAQYFLIAGARDGSPARAGFTSLGDQTIARIDAPLGGDGAKFTVFAGPKDRIALAAAGHDLGRALDFGWFWFIALPLLEALRIIHRLTGNYGVAIIVLTAMVKLATIPLTQTSLRGMREMQKLQPQMERIRERHKEDQAAQQREIMELYKRHKVNPLSGCLPMLLQMPIFVGLYNAIMHAIELRHAPFMMWINDLSAPDRLPVMGVGIPVLTVLMGLSMLVQQWMTPKQGDPAQQRMMMIMPVVFTFMFINFPSGLVLYWLVNNVLSIGQQWSMLRSS